MALVDQILDTLDGQWTPEAESHLAAYCRGAVQAIPLDEAIHRNAQQAPPLALAQERVAKLQDIGGR